MDRKLAAILAADVVGYSTLMERDEKGTHERLTASRKELFEPEIARHHGRIFKLMGDGMLAEFSSIVDAVECAVTLQRGLADRNQSVSADQRILVRIGINLGEVIVEGDDRYGEGVNIAARLEQLAEPGGICVSAKVAKEVEKKLAFGFEAMGAQRVKNISEPLIAFRVKIDGVSVKRLAPVAAKDFLPWVGMASVLLLLAGGAWIALRGPMSEAIVTTAPTITDGRPSLVVLPFTNLGDDKEQGYLADGITEDLTTELARLPGLFVVSRNAAFIYKGKATPPAQISKELGVRYILEGSTRRAADAMRINAQLIDAETGGHVWAERFDGQWADVFALQDKVVGRVARELKLRLVSSKIDTPGGTKDPAAYDAYLRGLQLQYSEAPNDWLESIDSFAQALSLDPDFGSAAAQLAWMYKAAVFSQARAKALGIPSYEASNRFRSYFEKAAKNPSATYYQLLSEELVHAQKSDEAITVAERSIALDPSDSWGYEQLAYALIFNGRPRDGRDSLDAALRVDPKWSDYRYFIAGLAEFSIGRFDDAVQELDKIDSGFGVANYWDYLSGYVGQILLVATYGHLGRHSDAEATSVKLKPYLPDFGVSEFTRLLAAGELPFKNDADRERLLEGLRRANVPELPSGAHADPGERIAGTDIKSLFFGHTAEGREVESGNRYWRKIATDGSSEITIGPWADKGMTMIEGNFLCYWYPSVGRGCHAIFRNPYGMRDNKNEYRAIRAWNGPHEYSVVQ
jgi:TolB-like protein/class 3 adenylate cyclase